MSKAITQRLTKLIDHKVSILVQRAYLAIIDKIFDAENIDDFEMDDDNNIYITYSLKKDESIIAFAHDIIIEKIILSYRKKLQEKIEEDGYFVEYEDSEIHVYFEKVLKLDAMSAISLDSSMEQNILKYVKEPSVVEASVVEPSSIFDFGA
jgi:hypothetical protein